MMFNKSEINNILFGAIRNEQHFKVRKKGYFINSLKLLKDLCFVKVREEQFYSAVILNLLSPKLVDLRFANLPESILIKKKHISNPYFRSLYKIELLLNICFLINIHTFHKIIFNYLGKYGENYILKYNLLAIICGPSTMLSTFMGTLLNEFNKPVIIVQHGIYQLSSYKVEWYEKFVMNKILVWGEYYKLMYESQGVESSKLEVVPPYFSKFFKDSEIVRFNARDKKLLFIGQQLNKISEHVYIPYNKFINLLVVFGRKNGLEIWYKPHPREIIEESLTNNNLSNLRFFTSNNVLDKFDMFFSVNSTLLIEMYLRKKICFQIDIPIPDFAYDHFNSYSGIPLLKGTDINEIFNSVDYKFWIDAKYLDFKEIDYRSFMANKLGALILENN